MEDLVVSAVRADFWRERRVLITGHTGFKGAWLALWLSHLGAHVCGLSLESAAASPTFFHNAHVFSSVSSIPADIRDLAAIQQALDLFEAETVFHLAAQPLVLASYADPISTYASNVLGTANLLEAVRRTPSVRAVVCVTSDKCYDNQGHGLAFRETDPLGGADPYSSSKACAELVVAAYRRSFFSQANAPALASARSGNVIGGGDFAPDRLLPDLLRSFGKKQPAAIRHPDSIRPWLHVLDSLNGYVLLAQHLLGANAAHFARAYNFGPAPAESRTVRWLADTACAQWGGDATWQPVEAPAQPEASRLTLDSSRARADLGWAPRLSTADALAWTIRWHQAFSPHVNMQPFSLQQIANYTALPPLQ